MVKGESVSGYLKKSESRWQRMTKFRLRNEGREILGGRGEKNFLIVWRKGDCIERMYGLGGWKHMARDGEGSIGGASEMDEGVLEKIREKDCKWVNEIWNVKSKGVKEGKWFVCNNILVHIEVWEEAKAEDRVRKVRYDVRYALD